MHGKWLGPVVLLLFIVQLGVQVEAEIDVMEVKDSLNNLGMDLKLWKISAEVEEALKEGKPVVALESTVISHGMPYPQNMETGLELEGIVRANGAIPATIAILNGIIHVGLERPELEQLAKLGHEAIKTSRRDVAYVISGKKTGATTVSGTSLIAAKVGIKVFVTGGIGGVHRHGETTMDISADLRELGRTPIAVVCAGAKSILDIGRTLEYLETEGVAVIGYGTDEFPAFFTPKSGHPVTARMDTPDQVAQLISTSLRLNLGSGIVIGVPIPAESATELEFIEDATVRAIHEAEEREIHGKEITPFLLQRITELTGGVSLTANIALIKNNARIGSMIAKSLSDIEKGKSNTTTHEGH